MQHNTNTNASKKSQKFLYFVRSVFLMHMPINDHFYHHSCLQEENCAADNIDAFASGKVFVSE